MPELPIFLQQLIRVWPPEIWRDVTVLVAVSGGPDSVALLCGLAAVRLQGSGQLIAAHFNHGLRGEQSEADEAFVVDLCQRLGISCEVGRADRAAGLHGVPDGDRRAGQRRPKRGPIAGRPLSVSVCDSSSSWGSVRGHGAHGRRSGGDGPPAHPARNGDRGTGRYPPASAADARRVARASAAERLARPGTGVSRMPRAVLPSKTAPIPTCDTRETVSGTNCCRTWRTSTTRASWMR